MKILHTVELYYPNGGGMYEVVRQLSERMVEFGHDITVATKKLPKENKRGFIESENILPSSAALQMALPSLVLPSSAALQMALPSLAKEAPSETKRSLACFKGVKIREFDLMGNFVTGIKGEIKKYQEFLINSDFEIITNFAAQQPLTDVALPILDKIKAKKIFVPTGFSAFYMKEYEDYFERMKKWMKQYDMNVFLSDEYRDVNFARENGITKRILIPNGADEREFLSHSQNVNNLRLSTLPSTCFCGVSRGSTRIATRKNAENNHFVIQNIREKLGIPKNHFLILQVGSHTGTKGHREATEIFTKTKIKNAVFLIIGKGPGGCFNSCKRKEEELNKSKNYRLSNKKLIVRDLERKEIVAAYQEADLFLFPSNIECSPIVLFEAMASRTPFLTTDVGNAAEIIRWSGGGMLLPTEKNAVLNISLEAKLKRMAKKILNYFGRRYSLDINYGFSKAEIKGSVKILEYLYNNPQKRNELTEAGYKSWLEKFTWQKIARDYEDLYKSLGTGAKLAALASLLPYLISV